MPLIVIASAWSAACGFVLGIVTVLWILWRSRGGMPE